MHGRGHLVHVGEEEIWRSELMPGWNWDQGLEPYAEGAPSWSIVPEYPA